MLTGMGLILLVVLVGVVVGIMWRFDRAIERDEDDAGAEDEGTDRIVTQVAAAQRLRREAAATNDPEERARLIKFADEADGTAEKIRRGLLSDQ